MKSEIKQKWLDALRSGQYEQGFGKLCERNNEMGDMHCCLGVLAEVSGVDRFKLYSNKNLDRVGLEGLLGDWGFGQFDDADPSTHTTVQRQLAAMNDSKKDFYEIADWIEANIPVDAPL